MIARQRLALVDVERGVDLPGLQDLEQVGLDDAARYERSVASRAR